MATWNSVHTLITGAGTITFNSTTPPTYLHDPSNCSGLDMAPLRAQVDDKPLTDGGIVHPFYFGARHLTFGGTVTTTDVTTRSTMEHALIDALVSIIRTDGQYRWVDGSTTYQLVVRCDIPVVFSDANLKKYAFGLVAADPTPTTV